jgi:hypothetical protein
METLDWCQSVSACFRLPTGCLHAPLRQCPRMDLDWVCLISPKHGYLERHAAWTFTPKAS